MAKAAFGIRSIDEGKQIVGRDGPQPHALSGEMNSKIEKRGKTCLKQDANDRLHTLLERTSRTTLDLSGNLISV
jgi:hypothetical protein